MGSEGVPMAINEINKAAGFKVGDKTYKIELILPIRAANRRKRRSS